MFWGPFTGFYNNAVPPDQAGRQFPQTIRLSSVRPGTILIVERPDGFNVLGSESQATTDSPLQQFSINGVANTRKKALHNGKWNYLLSDGSVSLYDWKETSGPVNYGNGTGNNVPGRMWSRFKD